MYIYKDPVTLQPFYIGKGLGKRKFSHLKETKNRSKNSIKFNRIQSILKSGNTPIIEEFASNLDEEEALRIETELIKKFGKIIDGSGILTNILDNHILSAITHSPGANEKRSKSLKGRKLSQQHRENIGKANMGNSKCGRLGVKHGPMKQSTRELFSEMYKGKSKPIPHYEKTRLSRLRNSGNILILHNLVDEIRYLYASLEMSSVEIAELFGLKKSMVKNFLRMNQINHEII